MRAAIPTTRALLDPANPELLAPFTISGVDEAEVDPPTEEGKIEADSPTEESKTEDEPTAVSKAELLVGGVPVLKAASEFTDSVFTTVVSADEAGEAVVVASDVAIEVKAASSFSRPAVTVTGFMILFRPDSTV